MLELIIGIAIGIIIGLTPGLHPNTIIPALILIAPLMTPLGYATLLVSLLITTNYFEFVKTTHLSAPDEGNALSMKYAQKLLLNGRGAEAVKLLSIGALGTILITAIIAPTIIEIIPIIEKTIKNYIGVVLIGISLHLILKEKRNIGK
ncbi:MAG TPA: tripartite tricarboxylate transporter permease, partial [Candidatus Nanoarchaeia archaeon]|nr:tripartite tricarboxylate transporter permease [Candidatus Nanoarchaeia archaeon]